MSKRILMGFVALGCVFAMQPQRVEAAETPVVMKKVMPDALAALEQM